MPPRLHNGRKTPSGDYVIPFDELKRFHKEALMPAKRRTLSTEQAAAFATAEGIVDA